MYEILLMVFQYAAIVMTAVFGILLVLAEDKEKSRLSPKGRIALIFAIASAMVAIFTQTLQLRVDREKTQALLHHIERGVYPLFAPSFSISSRWEVPLTDPALGAYRSRLLKGVTLLVNDKHYDPAKQTRHPNEFIVPLSEGEKVRPGAVDFGSRSVLFPRQGELTAKTIFADFGVEVYVFAKGNSSDNAADLNATDLGLTVEAQKNIQLEISASDGSVGSSIAVEGRAMPVELLNAHGDGKVVSLADLSEARLIVGLEDLPDATDEVLRIWKTERMSYIELRIGSKTFFLANAKQLNSEYPKYECRLPISMEYRDDPNINCE